VNGTNPALRFAAQWRAAYRATWFCQGNLGREEWKMGIRISGTYMSGIDVRKLISDLFNRCAGNKYGYIPVKMVDTCYSEIVLSTDQKMNLDTKRKILYFVAGWLAGRNIPGGLYAIDKYGIETHVS
jgi:hypothetical protein